jgi:hypothetical protein
MKTIILIIAPLLIAACISFAMYLIGDEMMDNIVWGVMVFILGGAPFFALLLAGILLACHK